MSDDDARWMDLALAEAAAAAVLGEVPVGCDVVGSDGVDLARAHNHREAQEDPSAHAEILALRAAGARLGTWRLERATAYVTLEPCFMCAGAFVNARIGTVVYGCADPKAGALGSLHDLSADARLNHRFDVRRGVSAEACSDLLRSFFRTRRKGSR